MKVCQYSMVSNLRMPDIRDRDLFKKGRHHGRDIQRILSGQPLSQSGRPFYVLREIIWGEK